MNCPKCGSDDTAVRDTRMTGIVRYRRRKCNRCGNKFSTMEIPMQEYIRLKEIENAAEAAKEVQQ